MQIIKVTVILIIALFPMYSFAAESGEVSYMRGDAWLIHSGNRTQLTLGTKVQEGDVVVTKNNGRVKLSMVDGSRLFIGSHSRLKVETYSMNKGNLFSANINMLWGKVRFFVSKLRTKSSSFQVKTKTAVIGVRGTEFAVLVPVPKNLPVKPSVRVSKVLLKNLKPTKLLLFSGAVVGQSVSGAVKHIKPGMAVNFKPSGLIESNKIGKKDLNLVKNLPAQRPVVKKKVSKEKGKENVPAVDAKVGRTKTLLKPLEAKKKVQARLPAAAGKPTPQASGLRNTVAGKPTLRKPVVTKPVVRKPIVKKPLIRKPVIKKPVIRKPVIKKPVIRKPVIKKPVIKKPVIRKPVIRKPVIRKPVIKKPVIKKPVIRKPLI